MIVRIYVIRCAQSGYWYVGQTTRLPWERLAEHKAGEGSAWTRRYGTDCMIFSARVPAAQADTLVAADGGADGAIRLGPGARGCAHVLAQGARQQDDAKVLAAARLPRGVIC